MQISKQINKKTTELDEQPKHMTSTEQAHLRDEKGEVVEPKLPANYGTDH